MLLEKLLNVHKQFSMFIMIFLTTNYATVVITEKTFCNRAINLLNNVNEKLHTPKLEF